MMGKKGWMFFKRLRKESSSSSSSSPPSSSSPSSSRRKFFGGSAFKWKRLNLQMSFIDSMLFKVVSVFEALVLVTTLAFFYLFCGCHF